MSAKLDNTMEIKPIKVIAGGTEFVPIAVFNIEKTIVNLKKGVIETKINGSNEKVAIVINNCMTGFMSFNKLSIKFYPCFEPAYLHETLLKDF